ncbi:hypothetical protein ACJJIG_16445 [Microbulbifer sp. SSSA007]|uniref:hypothetical protein n=1 Tax=Microbulbifer sp. SSSA007 TaxID=3243379 RepID=UPI004039A07B
MIKIFLTAIIYFTFLMIFPFTGYDFFWKYSPSLLNIFLFFVIIFSIYFTILKQWKVSFREKVKYSVLFLAISTIYYFSVEKKSSYEINPSTYYTFDRFDGGAFTSSTLSNLIKLDRVALILAKKTVIKTYENVKKEKIKSVEGGHLIIELEDYSGKIESDQIEVNNLKGNVQ